MLRQLTDTLNASKSLRRMVSTQFPEETIELSTAATILDAPGENPIGWSLRRFLQRRGNVVITDRRVFVHSSFRSPLTALWTAVLLFGVYKFASGEPWVWALGALGAGIFLFQRRPYSQNLPFAKLQGIRFGSVQGISGQGDILTFSLGDRALHLVTSKVVPEKLKRQMETRLCARGTQDEEG